MTTAAVIADGRMPLGDHLREARVRAVRIGIALVVGAVIGYLLSDYVLDVLRAPIVELASSRNASINYDSITGAFDVKMRVALITGVVLASPVWLYEVFAFITPGLRRRERRYAVGFTAVAVPVFAAGAFVGLRLFPHMVELMASFASTEDSLVLQASTYIDFVMKIVVATGIAFTLPVVLVMLNFLSVLSARTIGRAWRAAVIVIVAFSAIATPAADVLSMLLLAASMTVLYLAALIVASVHDRAVQRRTNRLENRV